MDGIGALKEAIRSLPIPGTPPPLSKEGAAVGLAFLDMALRQNHIRRLTERLTLVEHRAARRTTEVDIRLNLLDKGQREASHLFQQLTSRSPGVQSGEESAKPSMWVPVTRISRRSVAPIDVVDADGFKLPRLTQYETSRLLASGLYRLLRGILSSHPDSRRDSQLAQFLFRLDEARWLVRAALIALLTERCGPTAQVQHPDTPGTVGAHGKQYREIAIGILEEYESTLLDTYMDLLDVAVNNYLLVVALDGSTDDHLLSYDSPLHIQSQQLPENVLHRLLHPERNIYRVEYVTYVPSSLPAYHVVAETEPGVHIKTMSLTTNADEPFAIELATDLRTLAQRLREQHRTPSIERKLLELELQTALGGLSELMRTRRWEADQAEMAIAEDRLRACDRLAWASTSGEGVANDAGEVRSSLLRHPNLTTDNLAAAADEILGEELGSDYSIENDTASSRAQAYWRRDEPPSSNRGHTRIRCILTLNDATGTRPGSVIAYVASVVFTMYFVGCFLAKDPWPYPALGRQAAMSVSNADALVAVLLLVPGFLYSRLDLPARHTIIGQLRSLSRHVAHVCIGSAVLLSAGIAAGISGTDLQWLLAVTTLLPVVALVPLIWRPARRRRTAPFLGAPKWLRPSAVRPSFVPADAVFHSSGSDQ